MEAINREWVISVLMESGARYDGAAQYADAFLEYQIASANISKNGIINAHPRTGNPIENPFLVVRDRALKKLQSMRDIEAGRLWELVDGRS